MLLALAAVPAASLSEASAETRTLKLYYTHTREKAEVTFKRNGRYLPEGLKKANHMMRDWRRNEPTKMDPKLLDLLWEVYKEAGGRDYIHIVSGYRSPATNSMLRRTRGGQAEKSQHMVGKAVDFFIPGVKLSKLRSVALRKQGGGVGFYPKSGSPFVHIDTGRVRHWPRMSRKELVAVFPNGKTLHVPSDGKPLPGYEQALAAYKANGRGDTRSQPQFADDEEAPKSGGQRNLLAILFGGGADESEDEADAAAPAAAAPAPKPQPEPEPVAIAAAPVPEPVQVEAAPRPVPPAEIAAAPVEPQPQPEPEPQFAALPGRNAPVPSPAPRAVPVPQEPLIAAAPEGALGESEIAALLAADIAPAVPEPSPALAALAPSAAPAADAGNPFAALLPADGLAPSPRPDGAPQMAAVAAEPEAAEDVVVALAPVPQPRPDDAPVAARSGRVTASAGTVPAPKAERVVKGKAALAALAPATQGKSGRVAGSSSSSPAAGSAQAVAPLPVDSSRFGPRASGDSDAQTPVDQTRTASIPEKPTAPANSGDVLPDGSVLIKAGKIPLGD